MALNYGLGNDYEGIAVAMCGEERFWKRVGRHLNPKGLSPKAALLWSVFKKFDGRAKPATVFECLEERLIDGMLTPAEHEDAADWYFGALERLENENLTQDEILGVIVPRVQRAERQALIENSVDSFTDGGDLADLPVKLARVAAIGAAHGEGDLDEDTVLNLSNALTKRKKTRRLDLGILEVDTQLGGIPQGTETVFVGGTGEGKSMALSQIAAYASTKSLNVAIASLEIGTDIWNARFGAALTDISVDMLLENDSGTRALFARKMATIIPNMGATSTRYFSPRATTVREVIAWCEDLETRWKRPVDVLVVDYADKLVPESKNSQDSSYAGMGEVYENLRIWAAEGRRWIFTASQAKGRSKKDAKHKRDVEDASDSMNKGRVADLVLTLNKSEGPSGERLIEIFCAKNRYGEASWSSGPLTTSFETGKLCV